MTAENLVFHKYDVRKGVSTVSVLLAGHVRNCSIIYSGGPGVLSLLRVSRPALGSTQPPTEWLLGSVTLGMKQLGCIPDHSPTSSAKFKNDGAVPLLPIHLYGMQVGSFTFCIVTEYSKMLMSTP